MARRKPPEPTEVPMSAMIDVVFLLLIFFIATKKPTIAETHVAINLPAPSVAKQSDTPPLDLASVTVAPLPAEQLAQIHQLVLRARNAAEGEARTAAGEQLEAVLERIKRDTPCYAIMEETRLYTLAEVRPRLVEWQVFTSNDPTGQQTVFIKMHPEALEGQLVWLLDACSSVGLEDLNVVDLQAPGR